MDMAKVVLLIAYLIYFGNLLEAAEVVEKTKEKVFYLEPGSIIDYQPIIRRRGFFENDLRIYCFNGTNKTLLRIFESVELQLDIEGDDYTQYDGTTPKEVRQHYDEQRSLFSFSLFSRKVTRLQLSPFERKCIGIETLETYRVCLQQLRVDFWRVIQLSVGLLLFWYAGHLSHNTVFYYITGVILGICSSFMLLIWLSSKLMPRRTMMYGALIGGWAVGIYVIQMLWENIQTIALTYRSYVFWYILITGIVSFLFCYRLGPPQNKRSKNIIKWLLQLIALLLIYFSSYFEEATAAIIIITIVLYYFPRALFLKIRSLYMRRFPTRRRLLTNEEYYEQGVRETTKALEDLRSYASSPDCKQWKVMSKLREPMRFAAFVEGASHLRDEEILNFESFKDEYDDSEEEGDGDFEEEDLHQRLHNHGNNASPSTYYQNYTSKHLTRSSVRNPSVDDNAALDADNDIYAQNNAGYKMTRHSYLQSPTLNSTTRHSLTLNSPSSITRSRSSIQTAHSPIVSRAAHMASSTRRTTTNVSHQSSAQSRTHGRYSGDDSD